MHWGREEMLTEFQWGKLAGSVKLDDLSNEGKILKCNIKKQDGRTCYVFICLRTGTISGL